MLKKALALGTALCALSLSMAQAAERTLTVFAAASLTDVLQQVGDAYTAETRRPVRFSFAASSALARQIESGAPADLFMSADQEWMDYLQARKLIQPGTRANIVANTLVLVAPAGSKVTLKIEPGFGLAAALGKTGRIATGDPASVPVGKYAQVALTRLGVWASIENRLVPADNVRTALNFVARGEVPLGIVYATDAKAESRVRVVDVFPASSHDPINYPAAATAAAGAAAMEFLDYLRGPKARGYFDKAGFGKP
jgi:molybdate transport system substrate-binding protein